jgi:hypothetical protein
MLLLLQSTRLGVLLHERISDRPRRRLFVATVSLFLTFAGVRGIVYCITHQIPPPFHFVVMERRHIHHFVFGIPMLLAVGYAWLAEIGVGVGPSSLLASRLFSILYGVGAAHSRRVRSVARLRDVYWSPEGRASKSTPSSCSERC